MPPAAVPAAWRRDFYGFVGRALHGEDPAGLLEGFRTLARQIRGAGEEGLARDLESWVAEAAGDLPEAVRQDFDDLFRVPAARFVTPHESVYTDPLVRAGERARATLWGPSTVAVGRLYREAGLEIDRGYEELPDYAGAEIAFLEFLCTREAAYAQEGMPERAANLRRLQTDFLEEHALRWIPRLLERVSESAGTRFYGGLARVAASFLESEARRHGLRPRCAGEENDLRSGHR